MRGREAEARPGRGRAWSEPETSREAQKIPGCRLRLSMTLGVSAPALLQRLPKKSLQGQTAHPRGRAAGSRPTSEPGLGMLRGWGEDSSTIGFETIGPSIWKR